MSVNITVNGKFAGHCQSHPLLADPQEVRKAEEKERRKLRLLQVREESKKLAKKIRDEVNEEKKKELQKLQETKQRELECWRQHALQHKGVEYRAAIFQIGTAHEAAKRENNERDEKQKQRGSYKDFRKQIAARKCQAGKVQFSCQPFCPCQQNLPGANKQFKCTCTQTEENSFKNVNEEAPKRKRDVSISSSESECEDEDYKEQTTLHQSSFSPSSTCDTTSSFSTSNHATQTSMFVPTKNKCLIKTPAVYLDVEVGTDDSVTISAPAEVKGKPNEYSRQFSSVIRVSPRKGRQQKESTCENTSMRHSSTATTTLSSDIRAKEHNMNKSSFVKSPNKQSKEKRFTIISELVKKQQEHVENAATSNCVNPCATNSQVTSTTITPHLSPKKQPRVVPIQPPAPKSGVRSPRKTSAASKSSRTTTQPLTSFATTAKTNSVGISGSSCSGRVQFYDYNSKFAKEQDQAASMVSIQRQRDQSQPSAMQQAEMENQKERERQLEELKKCQVTEERGQKALEREQIRRDCNELTEKLEVLSREYANQLPSNENQLHIFADKQLRKEGKMNSAIEKLLQRPSIITCSEKNKIEDEVNHNTPANKGNLGNLLNVASLDNKLLPADDVSSDSCCSILLGYVDDQSRLVKQDLQNNIATQNQSKHKRLKNLLKRLDELRSSLIEELKNENERKDEKHEKDNTKFSSKKENLRQVIDSISDMRKEHEQIVINENDRNPKLFREREKELEAKEALLDRKVREFYELQKQGNKAPTSLAKDSNRNISKQETGESSSCNDKNKDTKINYNDRENIAYDSRENPLEIIITVKGETKCVKIPQKTKRKISLKKSPSKLATLIRSPQPSLSKTKKHTPTKKAQTIKLSAAQSMVRRRNSYDSNSTSYMSLPPELTTKIDDIAQRITQERLDKPNETIKKLEKNQHLESETSLESLNNMPRYNPPPYVNPLIAQYVNRLLGMSRDAVQKLAVSSSDIETPGSSIINTTGNVTNPDIIISDERFLTLHNFIEENKSFIKDIEQSIRSQNNVSLENSIRMLDDIWRRRLKSEIKDDVNSKKLQEIKKKQKNEKDGKDNKTEQKSPFNTKEKKVPKINNVPLMTKILDSKSRQKATKTNCTDNILKDFSKSLSSHYSTDDKESTRSSKMYKRTVETVDKAINAKLSIDSNKTESDSQIARYAKLTENCTHRIAELTELINRVREEKQRLLEVTLSSVSDNGRQSTEYLELPEGKTSTRNEKDDLTRVSSSSEETTQHKQSLSTNSLHEMHRLSSADKNKQLANSRDSGIAESRPITALENRIDQEPLSLTSSESTMPQGVRKMKPPPTLKRFSPQLPEDELAHELSTIFEVDTPATSRINTAAGQSTEEKETAAFNNDPQQPVKFPTFEQYLKQLDLDITQLGPEQSIQLQQEFTTFLECLQRNRLSAESPKYSEFPSINAYIQQLAEADLHLGETLEESLAKLHISGIQPHNFPAVRDYIRRNTSKSLPSGEQQLLDTESLENITDAQTHTNTDDDTDSIDIQEELKKRNIIKNSFRVSDTKKPQIFSSTAHRDAAFYQDIVRAESGVDKLSTSGNTSDLLDSDLKRMVQQWSGEVRKKSKDIKILSSTTTSSNVSALAHSALRAASLENSSKDSGRAFNLRDFLTRELEKLASNSSSTTNTSSDESLRSNFLHSLIGSLTPRTTGAASKSGAQTLDRQKTSTPVPMPSSQARSTASSHSNSSSQLFSGESRLSSVHYQDRSVHFHTSANANADQSSE